MTYIDHDSTDPFFNFAAEEYFMNEKDVGDDSLFMFWRTKPTLMVGRFQNTIEEINRKYAEQNGILIVRRNSGGGTIYTDEGAWQFSFIIKNYEQSGTSFQSFTRPILDCLCRLGVNAEFNSRNDLTIGGRKFSGNAQYRKKNAMIHHGSVLFDADLSALVKSLSVSDDKIVSKGIKSVKERVTNLKDHLPCPMSAQDFKICMVNDILESSGKRFVLSAADKCRIEEIADAKFRSWEWNFGHSPVFAIERKKRCQAGGIQVKLNVKNGKICECGIFGDFFASGDIEDVEKALCGIPYEKKKIGALIEEKKLYAAFYSLSAEELLASIID